jgi:tetratricopeptide (TPR) repeat protein
MIEFIRDNNLTQTSSKSLKPTETLSKKAYSFHHKGDALFLVSRFAQAKEFYEKSLEAYLKAGDSQGTGLSLLRLGRVAEIMGEYDQAREAYEESLQLFENLSDLQGIARSKAQLGNLSWATGDYAQASKLLDEALSFYRVGEDIAGEAWVHDLMGNLRLAMREDQEAERLHHMAFSLIEELGTNLENTAWNHYHLGALALFREQTEEAKDRFSEALKYFIQLKDELGQVAALTHLGEIACVQENISEAQKNIQKAVQLVIPTQCKPLLADVLTAVARLLKAQGDERKAISLLMVALSHPTCRQQTKDRMLALAMALKPHFSEKEAERGFQWAKAVSIEEMATSWVSSTLPKNKNKKK